MPQTVEVRRTYKYRLYTNREANRRFHETINVSGWIWNHITALRKRYFRRFGTHLGPERLQKLDMRTFVCDRCGLSLNRDHNAVLNIYEAMPRLILSHSVEDRVSNTPIGVHGRRPRL